MCAVACIYPEKNVWLIWAKNMFVDVVYLKVLIFIVSVIWVELPKIILHLLHFASDDLWMFRVSVVPFFFS